MIQTLDKCELFTFKAFCTFDMLEIEELMKKLSFAYSLGIRPNALVADKIVASPQIEYKRIKLKSQMKYKKFHNEQILFFTFFSFFFCSVCLILFWWAHSRPSCHNLLLFIRIFTYLFLLDIYWWCVFESSHLFALKNAHDADNNKKKENAK